MIARLRITKMEFELICRLRMKYRADWPACFSSNPSGEIWVYITNGKTPEEKKVCVQESSQTLTRTADALSKSRDLLGRFFINEQGAYWKDEARELHQFVEWDAAGLDLAAIADTVRAEESEAILKEIYSSSPKAIPKSFEERLREVATPNSLRTRKR